MKISTTHIVSGIVCGALALSLVACGSTSGSGSKKAVISAADAPIGWASYAKTTDLTGKETTPPDEVKGTIGGFGGKEVTVKTRDDLIKYAEAAEPYVIYVEGTIDMTDTGNGTMVPPSVKESTPALDKWIADRTAGSGLPVSSYKEWKEKYTASQDSHLDENGPAAEIRAKMDREWGELIDIKVANNKTIIGLGANSGLYGGSLFIKDRENIVIRNMNLTECYNPFPAMEADDELNAEWDCITVRHSKYIWIDHCTIGSSAEFTPADIATDKYRSKDNVLMKWQVHDGLLDITNESDFVTVSWTILRNHDKTMLIGSSDSKKGDAGHQTISLLHVWYDGCAQRLPMVRYATLHIANCYYSAGVDNTWTRSIDRRKDCKIYSEGNYFEDERKSITSNTHGSMYDVGSFGLNSALVSKGFLAEKPAWNPADYYTFKAEKAAAAKKSAIALAGAGKVPAAGPAVYDPK